MGTRPPSYHQPTASAAASTSLVALAAGVVVFHVLNSICQEAVFEYPGFHHVVALSILQTGTVALFAAAAMSHWKIPRRAPWRLFAALALLSTVSVLLTNEASRRLNYATQVVFKSAKLLFVMCVRGVIMRHRWPSPKERGAALLIVAGLITFTYATSLSGARAHRPPSSASIDASPPVSSSHTPTTTDPTHDVLVGTIAVVVALLCDALLYSAEEKYCFGQYACDGTEIIVGCNVFSSLYSGVLLLVTSSAAVFAVTGEPPPAHGGDDGTIMSAARFMLWDHPTVIALITAFSLFNLLGTECLLRIVSDFGANTAVVVTSTRKVVTVMASYLLFPKPFTLLHAGGLAAVAAGVYLHETSKSRHVPHVAALGKAQTTGGFLAPPLLTSPGPPGGLQPSSPA